MEEIYNDEIEIDLIALFYAVRERILIIILVGLLTAGGGYIYSSILLRPMYTSSTLLYVLNKETTLTTLTDLQLGTQLTKDYMVVMTSRPVLEDVIDNLGLDMDYEGLLGLVTISNPADTRILRISVNNHEPVMAKAIADELATVASERIAEIMDMVPPRVIEKAYVPVRKTSPSISKYTAIGGMAGIALAGAAVVILFIMNDKVTTSEDVERYLGLSTLGVIPVDEELKSKKKDFGNGKKLFKKKVFGKKSIKLGGKR